MASWTWGKTIAFFILYLFILVVTWKFRLGDIDLKWKLLTTFTAPIAIAIILYIKER